MAKMYLIENGDGDKWLSQIGFVERQSYALQFTTEIDAKQHLSDNPLMRDKNNARVVPVEVDDNVGRFVGTVATDYNPFSTGRPNG